MPKLRSAEAFRFGRRRSAGGAWSFAPESGALLINPHYSWNPAGTLHSICDETACFLQPLSRTLHLLQIRHEPLEGLRVNRTLAFHLPVAEKSEDDSARQFLLLEEFLKT